MKAMVLDKTGPVVTKPLVYRDVDLPVPQARQLRVRVEACGVCHTDLHTVEGDLTLPRLPLIPGHQVVGRVDAVGEGVEEYRSGDRVGLAWLGRTCRDCAFCQSERENLCYEARFTGLHFDGGYSQYALAEAQFAYRIPEQLDAVAIAPLLCAGIIGYRALRLSGIKPGQRLGLYGFGASAHIAIQIARHWGCEVYVFSRGREHRELAQQLGAVWTGEIGDALPQLLHASVIFAPAGALVPAALGHLEKSGTVSLAGIHMSQIPPLDYQEHLYHEKRLCSVANSTRRDGRELIDLAEAIPLTTHTVTYPLEQANEALMDLKMGNINGAAVLIPPGN